MKSDLTDLDINDDLQWIQSKSEGWFKNHVKRKVREYAFYKFIEEKEEHSKLDDLFYTEFLIASIFEVN